jgi:hypothetical protein
MVQFIYKDEEELCVSTTGCGCCSRELRIDDDTSTDDRQVIRDEIIDELKDNLKVLVKACDILGIDIEELGDVTISNNNRKNQ